MENFDMAVSVDVRGCKPRKKLVNKSGWKREQEKENRYTMKKPPKMPSCKHVGKIFKCSQLNGRDAMQFSKAFHSSKNKIEQDKFILTSCKIKPTFRTNRKQVGSTRSRGYFIELFIRKANGNLVRVCQSAFTNILNVSKYRVTGICKRFYDRRTLPVETRGGDRSSKNYEARTSSVKLFIGKIKVVDLHYCRSKKVGRQYLAGDLSINKMYRMYIADQPAELHVKQSYFRHVFNKYFNLGFKAPSSDKCSTCLMYMEQLKTETNPQIKSDIMIKKRVHNLRAQSFYHLAREEKEGMITISFDCQKNMVLPKVPDQAAYFSRQMYLYNFGVVQGSSSSSLNKDNVFLYVWLESEHTKGSNEIASALYHKLCSTSLEDISIIRLICDGCGAQNKNSTVMGMISFWLKQVAPVQIKEVQIIFPIPGHSYIPPDRVFAQIEKKVRAKERIIDPSEYLDMYTEHGQIIRLGSDVCPVKDWKAATATYVKPPGQWHFQFNKAKRFIFRKTMKGSISVRGEVAYRSDVGVSKTVLRKNRCISAIRPELIHVGVPIKKVKMDDVSKLLVKHFGENWETMEELGYYRSVLHAETQVEPVDEPFNSDIEECNHADEDLMI